MNRNSHDGDFDDLHFMDWRLREQAVKLRILCNHN